MALVVSRSNIDEMLKVLQIIDTNLKLLEKTTKNHVYLLFQFVIKILKQVLNQETEKQNKHALFVIHS